MIITANYHVVIALYSGSQLLMNCGKGECPWGARYWRLAIVFDYPNANVLGVAEYNSTAGLREQGRTHTYTTVSR
jgi:hypothetical protein